MQITFFPQTNAARRHVTNVKYTARLQSAYKYYLLYGHKRKSEQ